jgi:hypothetical protein
MWLRLHKGLERGFDGLGVEEVGVQVPDSSGESVSCLRGL